MLREPAQERSAHALGGRSASRHLENLDPEAEKRRTPLGRVRFRELEDLAMSGGKEHWRTVDR